jgi:tetratricopeptide (TPR) repeat protein
MPRPSKRVSPETLGGRIRAAREHLRLSLADVANGHYSTSLISQIERNRIDPSQESLRFLADRLHIPLEDLELLARSHREINLNDQSTVFEELVLMTSHLIAQKEVAQALAHLQDLHFSRIPPAQRWRLAALRGQCYFAQRKFLKAQHDFVYAVNELPSQYELPQDQKQVLLLLHLHLAGSYRELCQLDAALEQYKQTLQHVNSHTPSGYVAEIHWGMALIAYAQAKRLPATADKTVQDKHLRTALEHAENARFLYRSIGSEIHATAVTCHIAHIEELLGEVEKVRSYLQAVLATWEPVLKTAQTQEHMNGNKQQLQAIANVVSSAAYSLARIELKTGQFNTALQYSDQALEAAKKSYKLRRADAYLLRGHILETLNLKDPEAELAFRAAIEELQNTDRIAARISAHVRFGQHLLKIGKEAEGEHQLEQARLLSDQVSAITSTSIETEDITSPLLE